MELKTWLNQERGRATSLAAHLHLSLGRISQIADEGVPKKYMIRVRDFTGNAVTLECMASPKNAPGLAQPSTSTKEVGHG